MSEGQKRINDDTSSIVLGLVLLAASSLSFAQHSERFETPFGEKIAYSANESELCLQMEQRMKDSPMGEKHSILADFSFKRDVCAGSPMLEKRDELCSSEYPLFTESCNRNFFAFLLAAKQCAVWIRFGTASRENCADKLGASYAREMFEREFRAHTAYVLSNSLMDEMERLIDERSQAFTDGYELASTQTKTVLDKWNSTEADFLRKWEELAGLLGAGVGGAAVAGATAAITAPALAAGAVLSPIVWPLLAIGMYTGSETNKRKTNEKEQKLRALVWNRWPSERGYIVLTEGYDAS
jgi:hypothetical protein